MTSPPNHARFRLLRLGMAVGTSLLSKMGSVVLQLVAIPVAVGVLGFEKYGVFAALTAAFACLGVSGIGVGPGLTKAIARTHAAKNETEESAYFTTALLLLSLTGMLAGFAVYSVLALVSATTLFGEQFAIYQQVIITCAPLLGLLVFLETVLGVVERTQAGYQEMHRANLFGAGGNLAGGIVLLIGIHHFANIPFLVIAVLGMPSLARLCNAFQLLGWHRRYLLKHGLHFSGSKARELLADGVAFTASQAIAPLLMREGAKLIASHVGGPVAAGIFTVLNQLSTFLGGFITMISAPLWPALMDASARHDYAWFDSARRRLALGIMAYVAAAAVILTLTGSWLIDRWLGGNVHVSQMVLLAFSVFYVAMAWAHVNYICLTGLGILAGPAAFSMIEAVAAQFTAWLGMQWFGIPGLLWGLAIAIFAVTAWIFPLMLSQRMRAWKEGGATPIGILSPSH
jgi:O-antigen/teichoic acid export membrane protein